MAGTIPYLVFTSALRPPVSLMCTARVETYSSWRAFQQHTAPDVMPLGFLTTQEHPWTSLGHLLQRGAPLPPRAHQPPCSEIS